MGTLLDFVGVIPGKSKELVSLLLEVDSLLVALPISIVSSAPLPPREMPDKKSSAASGCGLQKVHCVNVEG
jgi:hypothetical protein